MHYYSCSERFNFAWAGSLLCDFIPTVATSLCSEKYSLVLDYALLLALQLSYRSWIVAPIALEAVLADNRRNRRQYFSSSFLTTSTVVFFFDLARPRPTSLDLARPRWTSLDPARPRSTPPDLARPRSTPPDLARPRSTPPDLAWPRSTPKSVNTDWLRSTLLDPARPRSTSLDLAWPRSTPKSVNTSTSNRREELRFRAAFCGARLVIRTGFHRLARQKIFSVTINTVWQNYICASRVHQGEFEYVIEFEIDALLLLFWAI